MKKRVAMVLGLTLCVGVIGCGVKGLPTIPDIDDVDGDEIEIEWDDPDDEIDPDFGVDDETPEPEDDGEVEPVKPEAGAYTNSLISDQAKQILYSLESDYNKVNWAVEYSPSEDLDGLVISVAPVYDDGDYYLVVGITNLYEQELAFNGYGTAIDANGEKVGLETYFSCDAIGFGSTYIDTILCGPDFPTGQIRWENVEIGYADGYEYTPWEVDWNVVGNPGDGYLAVNYTRYGSNGGFLAGGQFYVCLLDESGNIVAINYDYLMDVEAGQSADYTTNLWEDADRLALAKDVAFFANPVK